MYQDAPAAEFVYVLNDAGIVFAIAEDQEQVDKLRRGEAAGADARAHLLRRPARTAQLRKRRELRRADARSGANSTARTPGSSTPKSAKGDADDVSIMLYTSGTTGKPKGVCQTHAAFIAAAEGGAEFDRLTAQDSILSYLPMAWVGDHLFSYAQWLYAGFTINCPESGDTVMTDLREIGPTYYFAPPRVFENLLTQVMIRMEDASAIKRWLFRYFTGVARRCGAEILDGHPVGLADRLLYALGNVLHLRPASQRARHEQHPHRLYGRRGDRPRSLPLLPLDRRST